MVFDRGLAVDQPGQRDLAESVSSFLRGARVVFNARSKQLARHDERYRLCRLYESLIDYIREEFLPLLAEPHGPLTPPQIATIAVGSIRTLTSLRRFLLVLNPSSEASPESRVHEDLAAELGNLIPLPSTDAETLLPHAGKPLIVLSYPELQARNPIYHALLLGHEIMHLVVGEQGITKDVAPLVSLDGKDFDELQKDFSARPLVPVPDLPAPTLGESLTEAQLSAFIMRRWNNIRDGWLTEIACDLLATRYLGPAYVYAFTQLSLAADIMDVRSDSHPHSRFRLMAMLRELRHLKYRIGLPSARRASAKYLANLAEMVDEDGGEADDAIYRIAERNIRKRLDLLHTKVRELKLFAPFDAQAFRRHVPSLVSLLRQGIPPCENVSLKTGARDPASVAEVLNAAFDCESGHLGDFYTLIHADSPENELEACEKFQEIVLLALQGTEVMKAWASAAGELIEKAE